MNVTTAWRDIDARLRPFVAHNVAPSDVDDVMQDVFVRMQRGLGSLRDEERFTSWLFQLTRNSIADHLRARQRHPFVAPSSDARSSADTSGDVSGIAEPNDDREAARALAGCVSMFVARLPSPYREAVTLVELEGLTAREAAEMVGVSISGMKSRVQRGRDQLREMFDKCCEIALDARRKPINFTPRGGCCTT